MGLQAQVPKWMTQAVIRASLQNLVYVTPIASSLVARDAIQGLKIKMVEVQPDEIIGIYIRLRVHEF